MGRFESVADCGCDSSMAVAFLLPSPALVVESPFVNGLSKLIKFVGSEGVHRASPGEKLPAPAVVCVVVAAAAIVYQVPYS